MLEKNETKNQYDALLKFGDRVISDAKERLKAKHKINTGALLQSLSYEVIYKDDKLHVNFKMMPYGTFVDKGVGGANPSAMKTGIQKAPNSPYKFGSGSNNGGLTNAIKKWTAQKGLSPRINQSVKSMNFAITRSIYLQGISPTLFFTKAYNAEQKKMIGYVAQGLLEDGSKSFINNINIKK
jgi:hypothetical protein